ncbi:Peroxiredoxin-like 2A/B/C [Fimbriimonadaceae bacterium]
MNLPDRTVLLSTGQEVAIAKLFPGLPFALIFLRHSGCIFCREQIQLLNDALDLPIAFVTLSSAEESQRLKDATRSPHTFISDPQHHLYLHFGLQRASIGQLFGPSVVKRGFAVIKSGTKGGFLPTTDPIQLGGAFVIDAEGTVTWSRKAKDASDNVTPEDLRKLLCLPVA